MRRPCVLLAVPVVLLASSVAEAAPTSAVDAPRRATPGQPVVVRVAVGEVTSCRFQVGARVRRITAQGAGRLAFTFRVSRAARPGTSLRYVLRCDRLAPVRGRITVTGPGGGIARPRAAGPITAEVRAPADPALAATVPGPSGVTPEQAGAAATTWWATGGAAVLAGFRDGQCTDWASQMRPDVIERATVARVAAHELGLPTRDLDWTARNWAGIAADAAMTVRDTPQAGAIVVWQPGVDGAVAPSGHVGYVESVDPDGSFTTSEMNVGAPYQMARRHFAGAPVTGRQFIWR